MTAVYTICKEFQPPTGVEHAIQARFFHDSEVNLVVSKATLLQVYRINYISVQNTTDQANSTGKDGHEQKKPVLDLAFETKLFGCIESVNVVRFPNSKRDSLILSFRDAKASVVEWDPESCATKVTSLHYFEDDKHKDTHTQFNSIPILKVDKENRCAAMLIYDTRLVILPFINKKMSMMFEDDIYESRKNQKQESNSYIINLKTDLGIHNIKDFEFLQGYYDPTIMLLHEPQLTCTGRLAALKDTNQLSVISLSLTNKSHPVIWTVEHLPYDCYQLVSLPAPLSGVIVFSTNQLLYCSQNQNNTYVLAFNEYGALTRKENPFQYGKFEQANVTFALDAAHFTFLNNDNILLSLKTGELFVLTLFSDARTITHMELTKAGSSVLGSCMCTLGNDLLFLGSRMGDSLLIQYYRKHEVSDNNNTDGPDDYARPEKRMKLDNPSGELAVPTQPLSQYQSLSHNEVLSQKILNDEEFESLIYKTASSSGYAPQSRMSESERSGNFGFTVCDSLSSVGPVGDIAVGDSYDVASTSFTEITQKRMFEMVMCSGQGKNGAISIVQEGIRPEVITAFELKGCKGSWALRTSNDANKYHSFLVLSKENSTMVLSTGEELEEVTEKVEFYTQGATLDVGNITEKSLIVQVYQNGLRLLSEGKKMDDLSLPAKILQSSISDNYVLLLSRKDADQTNQDQAMRADLHLYTVKGGKLENVPVQIPVDGRSVVTAISLFSDEFDFFRQATQTEKVVVKPVSAPAPAAAPTMDDMDDEDLALYGSSIAAPEVKAPVPNLPASNGTHGVDTTQMMEKIRSTEKTEIASRNCYCVLSRENGDLEVYSVPEFKLLFFLPHFARGPSQLLHTPLNQSHPGLFSPAKPSKESQSFFVSTALDKQQQVSEPFVTEILMCYLDKYASNSRFPFLMSVLNTGDLLIYRSFLQTSSQNDFPIRFVKCEHEYIARHFVGSMTKKAAANFIAPSARQLQQNFRFAKLRRFDDVADKRGAFLVGTRPAWIMCERSFVRIHSMPLDGEVTYFTPFHNVNCAKGFIYFNAKGSLKICQLSSNVVYDGTYLHRKINIRLTPHKICFHPEMRLYALVVASKIPRKLEEEYKETEYRQISSSIPVFDDKFELRLISPQGWGTTDTFQFEDCEHVLCIKVLYLRYNTSANEDQDSNILLNQNPNIPSHNPNVKDPNYILKPYLVIGTGFVYGEDATCKGRIVIFDIIPPENQYHDPDSTELPKHKLKLVHQKEFKGPVSVVEHVSGFLLMNLGPKLVLYNFGTANELVGLAFYDAQIFIVNAVCIKNYILCADVYKSIFFLRWKEEERQLVLLAKDYVPLGVFAAEYLLSNSTLSFLVNDDNKNLSIFMYLPQSAESRGGQMLLCRSDYHLGSHINQFVRVPLNTMHREGVKHAAFFGTLDGGIGCVAPVDEVVFKRLFHLQSKMTLALPHFAGLNPKAFRIPRSKRKLLRNTYSNMLDGNLLWKFVSLEFTEQRKLARQIGTTPDQILDNLLEIDLSTSVFQ